MSQADDQRWSRLRTIALIIIAFVASVAALYLGSELLVPLAFALLFNAMLRPVVRGMQRLSIPSAAGAAIVVLMLIALISGMGYALSWPLENWIKEVPQRFEQAQARLESIRRPIERATDAVAKIESAARGPATAPATTTASSPAGTPTTVPLDSADIPGGKSPTTDRPPSEPSAPPTAPAPQVPPMLARVVGTTTSILSAIVEVLLMLYLLLASGDLFVDKLVKSISSLRDKKVAVQVVSDVESAVLRYMLVTALINVGQGIAVGLTLWLIGMPNPLLWGLFTFVLEFIPYLGGTIMVGLLTVIGIATFDNVAHALAAPISYLLITTIQNNVISPFLYGKRLKLNPVAVLLSVLFWWFIWGVGGAFIAVPIIAAVKIICDRTRSCAPLGEFLGE